MATVALLAVPGAAAVRLARRASRRRRSCALSPVSIVHAHYEMGDVPADALRRRGASAAATARAARSGGPWRSWRRACWRAWPPSAKFFGVVVVAHGAGGGPRGPAPLAGPESWRSSRRAWASWRLAAFVLSDAAPSARARPLDRPRSGTSPELFLGPAARRPSSACGSAAAWSWGSRSLWFGLAALCLAALAGAVALARRGWRGALVLVTPADRARHLRVVPAAWARRPLPRDPRPLRGARGCAWRWWRWPGGRGGRRLTVALGAGRASAARGRRSTWPTSSGPTTRASRRRSGGASRYVPPEADLGRASRLRVRRSPDPRRVRSSATDTQSDDRYHVWYAVAAESGEGHPGPGHGWRREGKLLRRFELLPRGFVGADDPLLRPRVDAGAVRLPAARGRRPRTRPVVFVDPDAVPDRAAVVVTPGHPRDLDARLARRRSPAWRWRSGARAASASRWGSAEPELARESPASDLGRDRAGPGISLVQAHLPRSGSRRPTGRVAVRLLRTPCEVAEQLLAREDWAGAASRSSKPVAARAGWSLPACSTWPGPARGPVQPDRARAALGELERRRARSSRGARGARRAAGRTTRGASATRRSSVAAASPGTGTPSGARPRRARPGSGSCVEDATASQGQFVRARPGVTPAGYLKVWLPEHFLRGRFHATFRVRGTPGVPGPIATLEVIRHLPVAGLRPRRGPRLGSPVRGLGGRPRCPSRRTSSRWASSSRVHYHGRGTLDVDRDDRRSRTSGPAWRRASPSLGRSPPAATRGALSARTGLATARPGGVRCGP